MVSFIRQTHIISVLRMSLYETSYVYQPFHVNSLLTKDLTGKFALGVRHTCLKYY